MFAMLDELVFQAELQQGFDHTCSLQRFTDRAACAAHDGTLFHRYQRFMAGCHFQQKLGIQRLGPAHVDLVAGVWRIAKTKNGTPQTVTLSPEAVMVLEARKDGGVFVFPGDGVTGHIVEPKKAWATLLKTAGIVNLRIHDLRRTLGSWQARTGASLPIIGKSLNHKTHQATAIYARLDLDPVRQSVNTATAAIMKAAGLM